MIRGFFSAITRNAVSLIGTSLALVSAVLIVIVFVLELQGLGGGPYLGILVFLILPAFLVLGLLLIPFGIFWQRRRARKALAHGDDVPHLPVIDLNIAHTRNVVLIFVLATVVNVVILASALYQGVHVMESNAFCGTSCHTPMEPEHTAYQRWAHSRVGCVECHIGPGAEWFVKSKLSGAWQLVAVTLDLFPRPIPTPIHNLRPSRETCEQCHWPTKFVGDRLHVRTHFAEDEANTELKSVVLLKVGGIEGRASSGIHWHVDPQNRIRYRSDETRETIYDVELSLPDGSVKIYRNGETPEDALPWREMDCVDCHNRPAHRFGTPQREVDRAMAEGDIDRSLPFVKREAVRLLQEEYASHEDARIGITAGINTFYQTNYPELNGNKSAEIAQAADAVASIFAVNVFPSMNVTWGTYPEHTGHIDSPGCFRCHNRKHKAGKRDRISKSCDKCHTLLAEEEANPAILQELRP